jgi:hypothetical protein
MNLPDGPAFIHPHLVKEIEPAELIAWYRVKQSHDFNAYRRFLRRFPNGHYTKQERRIGKKLYREARNNRPPPRIERRPPPSEHNKTRRDKRIMKDLLRLFGQVTRQAGRQ